MRGDLFRRMIINGRADMTPDPASEAVRQLRLRHQLAATVSDAYFQAGFTVIVQDVILSAHLTDMTTMIRSRPLLVVVLAPKVSTIADREKNRGKTAYDTWTVTQLDDVLRNETPRLGLWLDTSSQTPAETAGAIRQSGYQPADLRRLVLTHFHADHIGAATDIAGWGEVEVIVPRADAPFIRAAAAGPAPDLADWEQPIYEQVMNQLPAQPATPPRIDREIADGDELCFGDDAVAVAVPGHTPGSVAVYLPRHQVLFTGDDPSNPVARNRPERDI